MKNLIKILLIAVLFCSCQNTTTTNTQQHTYIYDRVRDGIAFTHAGHCYCNKKNK